MILAKHSGIGADAATATPAQAAAAVKAAKEAAALDDYANAIVAAALSYDQWDVNVLVTGYRRNTFGKTALTRALISHGVPVNKIDDALAQLEFQDTTFMGTPKWWFVVGGAIAAAAVVGTVVLIKNRRK